MTLNTIRGSLQALGRDEPRLVAALQKAVSRKTIPSEQRGNARWVDPEQVKQWLDKYIAQGTGRHWVALSLSIWGERVKVYMNNYDQIDALSRLALDYDCRGKPSLLFTAIAEGWLWVVGAPLLSGDTAKERLDNAADQVGAATVSEMARWLADGRLQLQKSGKVTNGN